jgi:hypothetical protein
VAPTATSGSPANDLLRLTTEGQVTTLGGCSPAAGPRKIATGPGNTLWTTLDLAEKIGRRPTLECTLTRKGKKPKSGACTSPRKYKLKQGRCKFSVAAAVAGVTGPAAVQKFRVVRTP